MKCPKCKYERKVSDTAPNWQCPQCGVAIDKYNQLMEENDKRLIGFRQEIRERKKVGRKLFTTLYLFIPISIIAFVVGGLGGYEIFWFLISVWMLYAALQIRSTGYYIGAAHSVKKGEAHPFDFKVQIYLGLLGSTIAAVIGFYCLFS